MNWPELFIGGIIGYLVSWYFYHKPQEDKWDEEFASDKQRLNRFLEKVKYEVELILEGIKEYEKELENGNKLELKIDTLYFRRLLNEDPFTLSFGGNFSHQALKPVIEARNLIDDLKDYLKKGEFKKSELIKLSSEITKFRLKIISIKFE